MNKIIGFPFCYHDQNWYDGETHIQEERISRIKHNVKEDPVKPYCDAFYNKYKHLLKNKIIATTATSQYHDYFPEPMNTHMKDFIVNFKPTNLWDYKTFDNLYYINHHQAHAAYAFLASNYKEADILAIDGSGRAVRTMFIDKDFNMTDLSDKLSIGKLWELISRCSQFGRFSEGKLMGASAFGKFNQDYYDKLEIINEDPKLNKFDQMKEKYFPKLLTEQEAKDYACTLQIFMDKIFEIVVPLKTSDNLCITGGVAYNGYMNEKFTKYYENVYVPPAPGDEGISIGCYMHADYVLNKNIKIPSVYSGDIYDYDSKEIDYKSTAEAISNGKIIGLFQGRSESGNRALGNRSILADPRNPNIKDYINREIKKREDFRPFAPVVLEEYYKDYFDTTQISPYMSRIVNTTDKAKKEIPGVIHVDGTARFQTVNEKQNPILYNLIKTFYDLTGVPVLLNTSFNCQEPIVETEQDVMNTFNKTNIDILLMG